MNQQNTYPTNQKFDSPKQVQEVANALLEKHLPVSQHGKYTVVVNNRLCRVLGRIKYKQRLIEISAKHIAADSQYRVVDTILHEIAHAIAGYEAGHGPLWRSAAERIGANPSPCNESDVRPKWQMAFVSKRVLGTLHVERFNHFSHRRTDISRRYIRGRKEETLGKLVWVEAQHTIIR